ncbi:peptidase M28 [Candidatus Entotheonella serta]|nr:peptidase M28 [Candidatus Entotheonella serta]
MHHTLTDLKTSLEQDQAGREMYRLVERLYPICRSITGDGVRETLSILQHHIPLDVHNIPTGTPAFDWTVPREWNIRDAYIKNTRGERVVDFQQCNLHVVQYSVPIHTQMQLADLKPHLHTLPEYPDRIPYRTSYYHETWGFCLSHAQLQALQDDTYEVYIDATLQNGYLTYGEYVLPGESSDEVLISCHICHPSLCNDNLSGIALTTWLAQALTSLSRRYTYRFVFVPATIGPIVWLSLNEPRLSHIAHGLVVSNVGDPGPLTYKKSRRGNAEIDRTVMHVLQHSSTASNVVDFIPYGYDERQYCSPGINLPMGSFSRTPHGGYTEYHSSADNLDFVQPQALADSLYHYVSVLSVLEGNRIYVNQSPKGEPQLGKRGLYRTMGGEAVDHHQRQLALLWVLNLSDGQHSFLDIADRSALPFETIRAAADALLPHDLLKPTCQ